ncbi:DUF2935 family protein [Melghiribacillus thermohalophilus]|uniref:DUF2935 family protein n=1 Tax=Melghiribacillus thermohalophilus TaxID=1324956 RepID=A0A4R3MZX5_9BACI|nr:DUF2935 domain-containing protein [Melghiribacillus thermohalophilus]TCT20323.1 DUF2935 family protein [Melghiribacillus thermohalophilus]
MKSFQESASFEHTFWLQIMGDHARFIRDSLFPSEAAELHIAKSFVNTYDTYLDQARQTIEPAEWTHLTRQTEHATREFREFKLSIMERHLQGKIGIHLSPTFINHMVNELDEYLLIIRYLKEKKIPPVFHELHHHLVWLLDAAGHAGAIHDELDGVEKRLRDKSQSFVKHFENFYLKATELTGYLRTSLKTFPALKRFNNEVEMKIAVFRGFLHEIEEMELNETVLGTFSGLMADHMSREECYYLIKLAESTGSPLPECDPSKPRTIDPH